MEKESKNATHAHNSTSNQDWWRWTLVAMVLFLFVWHDTVPILTEVKTAEVVHSFER